MISCSYGSRKMRQHSSCPVCQSLPSMCEAWVHTPAPYKPAEVAHACNPSTQESEAEGPKIKVILHSYKISLRSAWAT
ncbi:mCG1026717 [Mus musculus]|nr:mCG1026717 [Mus musculus]